MHMAKAQKDPMNSQGFTLPYFGRYTHLRNNLEVPNARGGLKFLIAEHDLIFSLSSFGSSPILKSLIEHRVEGDSFKHSTKQSWEISGFCTMHRKNFNNHLGQKDPLKTFLP